MTLFTLFRGRTILLASLFAFALFVPAHLLRAQMDTNAGLPSPGQIAADSTNTAPADASAINATPAAPAPAPAATPAPTTAPTAAATPAFALSPGFVLAILLTLASLGGFLLYQTGLTRAKNCGHTSTLLILGAAFALLGYWVGGFAVQTGGIGDAHAALGQPFPAADKSSLDHELGLVADGHYWGFMGNAGFFLLGDDTARSPLAALFLGQAALLLIAVAAALGAGLERARILPLAVGSFLTGAVIYPLFANWVWGGGWLAALGREYDLGHGFIDLGGAGVIHETAGTLALVIAVLVGPRHGRFSPGQPANTIPGHNMPFVLLGSILLLLSWTATNSLASLTPDTAALAALNTLLAAAAAVFITYLSTSWQRRRPEPAHLGRGLLGGAIATCGCASLIDPWAALAIGAIAGLVVPIAVGILEYAHIDDPTSAAATHGAAGAWGVLATGLFANAPAALDLNGIVAPVRGFFFGGAWHQLAAQAIGCVTDFVVVYILAFACLGLVHKILGSRVDLPDELAGLDWTQTGALGYQGDIELPDPSAKK